MEWKSIGGICLAVVSFQDIANYKIWRKFDIAFIHCFRYFSSILYPNIKMKLLSSYRSFMLFSNICLFGGRFVRKYTNVEFFRLFTYYYIFRFFNYFPFFRYNSETVRDGKGLLLSLSWKLALLSTPFV